MLLWEYQNLGMHRFFQNINAVKVYKRTVEDWMVPRFSQVELRIGNHDESEEGIVQFSKNKLVGFYPDGNNELQALFNFRPTSGQFLTLQIMSPKNLEFNELFVYSVFKLE